MGGILLIGSSFFGYRDKVAEEMRRLGFAVEVADDRPSESTSFKSLAKIAPGLMAGPVSRYAEKLSLRIAEGSFERVIYVGGMTFLFERDHVEAMRSAAPNARFTAYLWDSLANSPKLKASLDLFDRVLSFEPTDCETCGLELRPLFYTDAYSNLPVEPDGGFVYDACFIGSVHQPSKFEAVKRICDGLEEMGLKVFRYYYMPSKSVAALRKAKNPAYRKAYFAFEPLSAEQVAGVYESSAAIIDSPQSSQTGLTMRTLEAVGSRRKLITANPAVRNYDFYIDGDVFVSAGGEVPPRSFFSRPFEELSPSVYSSYSLEAFVKGLLGEGPSYLGYRRNLR